MLDFSVEVRGGDEVLQRLDRLDKFVINRLVRAAAQDIAQHAAKEAGNLAGRRTGNLAASIQAEGPLRTASGWTSLVTMGAPYGLFVDKGTGLFGRRHTLIVPRHAKHMVWRGKFGFMAKRTTRGQHAQDFMFHAYEITDKIYVPIRLKQLEAEIDAAF